MPLLNIHTHHPLYDGELTIPSVGLHPWYLTESWMKELKEVEAKSKIVGECGLDRLCTTPYDMQLAAFKAQIEISERLKRPLLLHCVRAIDDVLRLKRDTNQPWIYHGFRGNQEQLKQLLKHGFYVSFGFRHNVDSLRFCPADRLFLETDDVPSPITPLYMLVATLRNTTLSELSAQLLKNAEVMMVSGTAG